MHASYYTPAYLLLLLMVSGVGCVFDGSLDFVFRYNGYMITVIIAGGSGTRLWPLSTPAFPKHLLKLTGERSLIQMAYDRAKRLGDTVYIVTEASHSDHVREQHGAYGSRRPTEFVLRRI